MKLQEEMATAIARAIAEDTRFSPDMRFAAQILVARDFEDWEKSHHWKYISDGLPYYQDELCTETV